jgi:peptidoglycan/LPS O-acetylase OafA/YrhL
MSKSQSTYLDMLRIAAALTVLLSHVSRANLSGGFFWQMQTTGHDGVIVFFVLSGYVISYVAHTRERNGADYALSRLSRLYSVVLPALALTYVADRIGMAHAPGLYEPAEHSDPLFRFAASALFLGQSWNLTLRPFSNTAYWSLPYEFWYYALFGAFVFLRGWLRYVALAAAAAIAGPKILLLFPIWLFGVASYMARHIVLPQTAARLLFLFSGAGAIAMIAADMARLFDHPSYAGWPEESSPVDYALGAFVAANLFAASHIELPLKRFGRAARYVAGMTFALYLFHLPLLYLFTAYVPMPSDPLVRGPILIAVALAASEALSHLTERRNGDLKRMLWRRFGMRMQAGASVPQGVRR